MKIEGYIIGIIGTNCYLVINEETRRTVVVDPAASPSDLMEHIEKEGFQIEAILLTHGHFDHIMGLDGFLEKYDVPVYVHKGDQEIMNDPTYTGGYTFSGGEYIRDGQVLHLAGYDFEVFHTPGHTPGGCCFYIRKENVLFSGDTLFAESVGRTDFPGGSTEELLRSIQDKLLPLSDETKVYPGHMGETTIGHERRYNPFL